MSQPTSACRGCGCGLEGRDVYEGICKDCREDEILGGRIKPRKPRPPKPLPKREPEAPVTKEVAPKAKRSIDLDADTKELVAINADKRRERLEPTPDPLPTEDHKTVIAFAEFEPSRPPRDAAPGPMATTATMGVEDDLSEGEIDISDQFVAPKIELPSLAEPASRAPAGTASVLPPADNITLTAPPPKVAPPPTEPPVPLRFEGADDDAPAPESPAQTPSSEAPDLKIRLDHPAAEPAVPPVPEPEAASAAIAFKNDPAHAARLERIDARLDDLAARVGSLRARTSRAEVRAGFRFFIGVVLGLGVVALVAVGVTAAVGKLFYPPALDLLRRAAEAIAGR